MGTLATATTFSKSTTPILVAMLLSSPVAGVGPASAQPNLPATQLSATHASEPVRRILIANVTVLMPGPQRVASRIADVWLAHGKIQAVLRPGAPPPQSDGTPEFERIDGTGRFLSPGFIDSHVHLANVAGMTGAQKKKYPQALAAYWQQLPRSYLYFGFTGLIDLNLYHPKPVALFAQSPVAPRLWHCGAQVSVHDDFTFAVEGLSEAEKLEQDFVLDPALATPAAVANPGQHSVTHAMARLQAAGASCIKMLYEDQTVGLPVNWQSPSPQLVQEFAKAAASQNLPLVLHAPSPAGHQLALSGGATVLAHGLWARELTGNAFRNNELSAQERALLQQVARRKIGYQPTLRVIDAEQEILNPAAHANRQYEKVYPAPYLAYLHSEDAQWGRHRLAQRPAAWSPDFRQAIQTVPGAQAASGLALLESVYPAYRARLAEVLRLLQRHKANLLLGSDTPAINFFTMPPGLNGYLEMLAWQAAGIAPEQIIRAATYNNAKAFRLPGLGQIRPGMHADLLLMRENPLQDIRAVETIERVFVQGRPYRREDFAADRLP